MLNTQARLRPLVFDTLVAGCRDGIFVLRLPRPDRSYRTFWREAVEPTILRDLALEAALPELAPSLLAPGALAGLWQRGDDPTLTPEALTAYFDGNRIVQIEREGYTEPLAIPRLEREALAEAVRHAVRDGVVWLTAGPVRLYREDVPDGISHQRRDTPGASAAYQAARHPCAKSAHGLGRSGDHDRQSYR